ncbi:hypothetical protein CWI84_06425 [Idiomarina tyrosinivorans]|uniref:Glycosyl transferase family 1 domain-containing protein n=2 Tax=Idiomarina tyrosinivorans TaxID=1445662 RepID=A0A432ZQV5_9GAMM|nr:hypothetical protein CWI84_06425 [Idiomarina tyrosinivorans]
MPLEKESKSASGIRPIRMLEAFRAHGFNVEVISGYGYERRRSIKRLKKKIKSGEKYLFAYSEATTMPTTLTEKNHLPSYPLLDFFFFRFLKKENVPIGLFYRDVYWRFPNYGKGLGFFRKYLAIIAYLTDLAFYRVTLTRFYLPSTEMSSYIPVIDKSKISVLPPGYRFRYTESLNNKEYEDTDKKLKLFYVGGLSEHYRLHKLFLALSNLPNIECTVCTREDEWHIVKEQYGTLPSNISIIHESGDAMYERLDDSDIALLFVEPHIYWTFASPVKLFEYIGFAKPIIASKGTLTGSFVEANDIGWTIPYEENSIKELLLDICQRKAQVSEKVERLKKIQAAHTWKSRAKKVIEDLTP